MEADMEKKENRRVTLTKKLLQDALVDMLDEMPVHAVTIRELCMRAGINRTTFYHHYGSQYDLLEDINGRFLHSIAHCLEGADIDDKEACLERVVLVMEYLWENRRLCALLLNNSAGGDFGERLLSLPKISEMLNAALEGESEAERSAKVSFAIYGSCKLLRDWINSEGAVSPAAQAELMMSLARSVCRRG